MAYNQFFPQTYQYQGFSSPYQNQMPQQTQPQMQNGSFVSVRSIEEAYNWPVAPGNSITFKDENSPYVYTKTKGFSQLDQPIFEKYRLVKEPDPAVEPRERPQNAFDCEDEIKLLWDELKSVKSQIKALEEQSELREVVADAE